MQVHVLHVVTVALSMRNDCSSENYTFDIFSSEATQYIFQ